MTNCGKCGKPIYRQGMCRECSKATTTPSRALWIQTAKEEAAKLNVSSVAVLGGAKGVEIVLARYRAWKRLLKDGYTLSGIKRCTGFDHTSIRNAELAIDTIESKVAARATRRQHRATMRVQPIPTPVVIPALVKSVKPSSREIALRDAWRSSLGLTADSQVAHPRFVWGSQS